MYLSQKKGLEKKRGGEGGDGSTEKNFHLLVPGWLKRERNQDRKGKENLNSATLPVKKREKKED